MFDTLTVAFWFVGLITIIHPIYMFFKCKQECGKPTTNFYLKNHSKVSSYLGIHVTSQKGLFRKSQDETVLVEQTVFTLGIFVCYWQFIFKKELDGE